MENRGVYMKKSKQSDPHFAQNNTLFTELHTAPHEERTAVKKTVDRDKKMSVF